MWSNDSRVRWNVPAAGRLFARVTLFAAGGSAATWASIHATTWAAVTLRAWFLATVGAMFLTPTVMAQTSLGGVAPATRTDDIVKVADAYRRAVLAADAVAVAAVFSDDGMELPSHSPLVRGRTAIEQYFRGMFRDVKVTAFTFSHIDTSADANVAYDAGTYEQHLSSPSGQTVTDVGKYLAILKRTPMGWKAAYVMYNSDGPAMPCSSGQ